MDEKTGASGDEPIEYGLHTPMPGGSSYDIVWDEERVTVYLPPIGMTIDRFPDLVTGKESRQLVPCEILGADLPIEKQKWKRVGYPKDWKKWRREEKKLQRTDPFYVHPDAEAFRVMNWTRRINGCWQAIGNRNGKPTEYIYLPGQYWHFISWWDQDFGIPEFRISNWEVYLHLCWTYDNPFTYGMALAGNRRGTKTSISMHHMFELPSRMKNGKAGMQAQTKNDAKNKFTESLVYGFLRQPDFFKPKYDTSNQFKTEIAFIKRLNKETADQDSDDLDSSILGGRIDYRETKFGSYDGYKMHRSSFEEPGKWEEEDVDKTLRTIIPCMREGNAKLGCTFLPTTIEDMEKGGAQFIKIAEDSRPSLMKKNENGRTATDIVFMYQPAYKNYIFDEYGRAVIEDPSPNEKVYGIDGKRILKGAKSELLANRAAKAHNHQAWVEEVRKYSFTWEEAKMMDTSSSPFNVDILQKRLQSLESARAYPFVVGNFDWETKKDGEVMFTRDDVAGRWKLHLNPDRYGDYFDGSKKITNNVGVEMFEGKKFFFPKNNRLWRLGTDPIRYNKTDDPRSSKAGAYLWYKFDPAKDMNKPISEWVSHNFIAEYLIRPDEFEIFGEDMIKACRYFGCSILPEPNVNNLQQHFDARGYGRFILYRKDFGEEVIPKQTSVTNDYKGLESNDHIVDAYVSRLISFVNKHGQRIHFPKLCEQMISFTPKTRTKHDAVVGAGYAILAGDAVIEDPVEEVEEAKQAWFHMYDENGKESDIAETAEIGNFLDGY